MVLNEIESEDQSVDIFIKMGKSNAKNCHVPNIYKGIYMVCTVNFMLIYGFHTSGRSFFMKWHGYQWLSIFLSTFTLKLLCI